MTAEEIITLIHQHQRKKDAKGVEALCLKMISDFPDDPRPYSILSALRHAASDIENATKLLAKAVELEPENYAKRSNYGKLLVAAARFEEAREHFRAALKTKPDYAPAFLHLAQITKLTGHDPLIDEIEGFKKNARNAEEKSLAGFALGKLYDDIGDWDRAFANFLDANRLAGVRYNPEETRSFFKETKKAFTAEFIKNRRGQGHADKRAIFIVGMPRSGSSLVEQLLCGIPGVAGLGEREEFSYIIDEIAQKHGGYPAGLAHLSEGALAEFGAKYITQVSSLAPKATYLIDKNLHHYQAVGLLRLILPKAMVIHIRRDPIDTCLSCFFQRFGAHLPYTFDLAHVGQEYAAYADLMAYWEKVMPGEITQVDYEDVVRDQDGALSSLKTKIETTTDTDFDPTPNRYISTASVWQARQPVYQDSLKRWRNYEKHLGPLFKALEESGFKYEERI